MAGADDERYRDRTRERLLFAANTIVTKEGLGALQARRVSQDAECSIGTLYNIFGDIHGLILQTNAHTLQELGAVLVTAARRASDADLETRLNTLAVAYLDFATVNQLRWRAVFEHRLPDARTLDESYVEDRRRLLALIETQLEPAIEDPQARADAAHALFASVHGIVLLSLDAKLGPFDPAECERRVRFVVGHVVVGLNKAKPRSQSERVTFPGKYDLKQ